MVTSIPAYLELLQQAQAVVDWNKRIINSLQSLPKQTTAEDVRSRRYLRGRKRVFTDFAEAAEKVVAALLRSGILLWFQLETEVHRLRDLTLHEVQELSEFLSNRTNRFPAEKPLFDPLLTVLAEIESEILPYNHRPRFS
jgi:hypothetical protein